MLPVSITHPHTQVVQYPMNNPPTVPRLNLIQEAEPLLVPAASLCANEVGFSCGHSQVRMFLYNMVSSNNWHNREFDELVSLAIYQTLLKVHSGGGSPLALLTDSVREAVLLYAGHLGMAYPDLLSHLNRDQISAMADNARIYQEIMLATDQLIRDAAPYRPGPVRHYSHNRPSHHPMNNLPQREAAPHHRQAVVNPAAQAAYGGRGRAVTQPVQQSARPAASPASPVSRRPLNVTVVNPEATVEEKPIYQPAAVAAPDPTPTQEVTHTEDRTMDRNQHMIVYFGKNYGFEAQPVKQKVEEVVQVHENALEGLVDDGPSINDNWVVASCERDAFDMIRLRYLEQTDDTMRLTQNYAIMSFPVLSRTNVSDLFAELSSDSTFQQMQENISLYLEKNKQNDQLRNILAAVSQVDRVLTNLVNDWLTNSFTESSVTIDSFIQDIVDLGRYLHKKYDGRYNGDYQRFQQQVAGWIFQHTREAEDSISTLALEGAGEHAEALSLSYSVIYIDATASELNYGEFLSGKKLVSPTTDPVLFRLLEAGRSSTKLRQQENQVLQKNKARPIYNVLLTMDGACYRYYRILDQEMQYRLVEA